MEKPENISPKPKTGKLGRLNNHKFLAGWAVTIVALFIWLWVSGINPFDMRNTWIQGTIPQSTLLLEAQKLYTEQIQNLITALILIIGSAAGALTLDNAYRRTNIQDLESETNRDRLNTDIFSRAIEQLGSESAATRLGAIFSLESLAQDELDRMADGSLVEQISETLAAFVRNSRNVLQIDAMRENEKQERIFGAHIGGGGQVEPNFPGLPIDISAAVNVLARTIPYDKRPSIGPENGIDLSVSDLSGLNLPLGADLRRFNFSGCRLTRMTAEQARFEETIIDDADISKSYLKYSEFDNCSGRGTKFSSSNLTHAKFYGAAFSNVSFDGTALELSQFSKAVLSNCFFAGAGLRDADFSDARIILPNDLTSSQLAECAALPEIGPVN